MNINLDALKLYAEYAEAGGIWRRHVRKDPHSHKWQEGVIIFDYTFVPIAWYDTNPDITGNNDFYARYLEMVKPSNILAMISELERLNFIAWHIARIAAMYECESDDGAELDKTMCKLFKVAEFSVSQGASWMQRNTIYKQ